MKHSLAWVFGLLATVATGFGASIGGPSSGSSGGAATNAVATIAKDGSTIVSGALAIDFTNAASTVVTVSADGTTARVGIPQGGVGGADGGFILTNLALLGNTNATLTSGYWPTFSQTTNANYTLNFNHSFALPAGYRVTTIHTNSAATNYTVTLNTNTVAANFIDPYGKTNANSFSVTFGGKSVAEWMWTGNGWILLSLNGPTPVLKFGSGITAVTNGVNGLDVTISASGGGGSTTNAIPVTLAINGGTGSTNIVIDFWQLAQMSTNSVRVTLTANAGVVVTNIVDGKELVIDVVQDSTGNRTIAQSSVGGAPLRFGTDITGFGLSTNGTYIDHVKLRGVGTNAHVVGMIRGYAP